MPEAAGVGRHKPGGDGMEGEGHPEGESVERGLEECGDIAHQMLGRPQNGVVQGWQSIDCIGANLREAPEWPKWGWCAYFRYVLTDVENVVVLQSVEGGFVQRVSWCRERVFPKIWWFGEVQSR